MMNYIRTGAAALAVAASLTSLSGAALAQTPTFINFTGTDTNGGILSGTAEVNQEGSDISLLAFNATFSNLLQEGAVSNTATFTLADVQDGNWFTAGNPDGIGANTFSFDLSGTENGITGSSCYYDCIYMTDGNWANYFTTTVTSYDVPEPASLAILGVGVLGIAGLRRRASAIRG